MLGPEKCDDQAYSQFLKVIGQTGRLPDVIESRTLRSQIALGLGLDAFQRTALDSNPLSDRPIRFLL